MNNMLSQQQVLDIFRNAGAVMEGHFVLSSGRHSKVFLQKALVYQYPDKTEQLCQSLATKIQESNHLEKADLIIGPAMGGIIPAFVTAKYLQKPFFWVERENGVFALRRGFQIKPGQKVIIVEDIVTTGLSVRETITCLENEGAVIAAIACLIDRANGKADFGDIPLIALAQLDIPTYAPDELPQELAAIPAIKPGSRSL